MMQYRDYHARVEYDGDANIFHGEVINTRDVITFQGKSVTDLKKAFEESVDDYIAFCQERGEEPDKPFTGRLTLHLTPDLHKKVIIAAEKAGKAPDAWVAEKLVQATAS